MAKHSEPSTDAASSAKPKKSPLMLIGVAVLALAIGGGAAWFFMGHKSDTAAPAEAKPKHIKAPVFVTLEPFVVNLAGDVQHYLQVGIDLRIVDDHVNDQIKLHLPEIRNAVLLLLSSKTVEDLSSMEQKNRLRDELREAFNRPLGIATPAPKPNTSLARYASIISGGRQCDMTNSFVSSILIPLRPRIQKKSVNAENFK